MFGRLGGDICSRQRLFLRRLRHWLPAEVSTLGSGVVTSEMKARVFVSLRLARDVLWPSTT